MDKEKLQSWEHVVAELMEEYPMLREDDFLLYEEVLRVCEKRTGAQLRSMSMKCYLEMFGALRTEYGVPTFETVARVRRRAQKKNPHLRPKQKVEDSREEAQIAFSEYAVS